MLENFGTSHASLQHNAGLGIQSRSEATCCVSSPLAALEKFKLPKIAAATIEILLIFIFLLSGHCLCIEITRKKQRMMLLV
jgi:hypothetical protein